MRAPYWASCLVRGYFLNTDSRSGESPRQNSAPEPQNLSFE